MTDLIKCVIGKIVEKPRKFLPVVNERGEFEIVEKPRKFFPVTEREYLLEQRNNGVIGNGQCSEKDF